MTSLNVMSCMVRKSKAHVIEPSSIFPKFLHILEGVGAFTLVSEHLFIIYYNWSEDILCACRIGDLYSMIV